MSDWPALAPPYVTALPSSPVNGQQCILELDNSAGTAMLLRYNTAVGKWIALGGSQLLNEQAATGTTTSGTYADASDGALPAVTVPSGGVFDIAIGAMLYSGTANGLVRMSYKIGATAAASADEIIGFSANTGASVEGDRWKRQTVAGSSSFTFAAQYLRDTGGQTGNANRRWMAVRIIALNP